MSSFWLDRHKFWHTFYIVYLARGRDLSELTRMFVSVYSVWVSQILSLIVIRDERDGASSC